MLRRMGNKAKLAQKIQVHFPEHSLYIEPFFGAGGMFFNKPQAKYNILNDKDDDVYNFYLVLKNKRKELEDALDLMPIHKTLIDSFKKDKGTTDIEKAIRFVFLSNYTMYASGRTIKFGTQNDKKIVISKIDETHQKIKHSHFHNCDFREIFKVLPSNLKKNAFTYLDPPYLGCDTNNNYQNSWTEQDSKDMFECAINSGIKFAISEFDNPIILELAKKYDLNVIVIGERWNIKNIRTEILITNYKI